MLPYRLTILVAALVLLAIGGARFAPAQDRLDLGQVAVTSSAGFGGYGLPVANSALARAWAADGGLAWQVGMNYSTIPVFVDVEHRQPMARRVKITVTSPYGYAREELASAGTAAGETPPPVPETSISREVLVPPSVPVSIALLPRTCPPSRPGQIQRLTVSVEVEGLQQALMQDVEVIQLEPAHLYSLYLDGQPGRFFKDFVNENNHLQLQLPMAASPAEAAVVDNLLSSRHYILGIPRRELTLAPLAARDYAFVVAALDEVRGWPEEDQQALLDFALGGGRLCLFNAEGGWRGLNMARNALPLGRGYLIPVAGDFAASRLAMANWLEGELSEFTLWCRGTVGGWQSALLGRTGDIAEQAHIRAILGLEDGGGEIPSHRAGYLHPLWIYRETCFNGALEPWNYPEFTSADLAVFNNNRNLSRLARYDEGFAAVEPLPFMLNVDKAHAWPRALGWIGLMLPLLVLASGLRLRFRWLVPAAAVVALAGAAVVWWLAQPFQPLPLRAALFDVDQNVPQALVRELVSAQAGYREDISLKLEPDALVRRVSWNPAGDWNVSAKDNQCRWTGAGGGEMVSLFSESGAAAPSLPVSIDCTRIDAENIRLVVDTSGLSSTEECYMLTALGWLVLPGGQPAQVVHLSLPAIGDWPGAERIRAWEERLRHWIPDNGRFGSIITGRNRALLLQLQQKFAAMDGGQQPGSGTEAALPAAGRRDSAEQLIWMGLVQNPTLVRGVLGSQGVVFAPLHDVGIEDGHRRTLSYLRLTFSLEPPP